MYLQRSPSKTLKFQVAAITLAAVFALFPLAAFGSDELPEVSANPVDLESYSIMDDKAVGYGAKDSFMEWHGYINFEFDKKEGTNSNFDNHEFYMNAHTQITDQASVTAEFEYEHTPEKLILPIQAYGTWTFFPGQLAVRGGLFFVPIGIPRSYTLRGNKNNLVRQVALTHDIIFENWSQQGIELLASTPVMGNLSVFADMSLGNGIRGLKTGDSWFDADETLQNHTEDNNNNKIFAGRWGLSMSPTHGFSGAAGISFATQKYKTETVSTTKYDPTDLDSDGNIIPRSTITTNSKSSRLRHFGIDLRLMHENGLRFQGEWMKRSGGDNPVDLASGISSDAYGWYAQVAWQLFTDRAKYLHYLKPVFMVDGIDLNENTKTNGDKTTYSIGLNYSPQKHVILKLEYDFVVERHGESVDNNLFMAAMVMEF